MQEDIHDELLAVPLPQGGFSWGTVAVCVVALLLVVALVVWWRRRKQSQRGETLEARARRRMDEIHRADARGFHTELAAVLVEYIEARVGLRATRLTSVEIVREFRRNGVMSPPWIAALSALLTECDLAKFAGAEMEWHTDDALQRARRIVDELAAQSAASPRLTTPWEWEAGGHRAQV